MSMDSDNTVLVFKEAVVKDEFGSSYCSTHSLCLPGYLLGECPECHTLWRNDWRDDGKWSRDVCWFCPAVIAKECPFFQTPTCKSCKSSSVVKYPFRVK